MLGALQLAYFGLEPRGYANFLVKIMMAAVLEGPMRLFAEGALDFSYATVIFK